ncbi:MAG: DNA/RNA nuclease SfsA [Glaciecola sp.]
MVAFPSPLTQATLVKRYKRFLADVILDSGEIITVHCPNTGAMTGCDTPGSLVYLSQSSNTKRKYTYTWEYASDENTKLICVNTSNANKVVKHALQQQQIPHVSDYSSVKPEVKVGNSRIDFLLTHADCPNCYIEVKSVTLAQGDTAMFPDTVTTRGQKHCYELAALCEQGHRAILLFCVMRQSIEQFKIAQSIDPDYAEAIKYAMEKGVEVLCYGCELTQESIRLKNSLPIL